MKQLLIIYAIMFSIGAIGNYIAIKKQNADPKLAWQKYFTYLAIVLLVTAVFETKELYVRMIFSFMLLYKCVKELRLSNIFESNIMLGSLGTIWLLFAHLAIIILSPNVLIPIYLIVFCFDGMAQIGGQLIGGPSCTPNISPNKKWSGIVVGGIFAILAYLSFLEFEMTILFPSILFALVVILGAFCGDIFASYIKRKAGIKDYANYLPGHGGVLDRMDSTYGAIIFSIIYLFITQQYGLV